MNGNAKFPSQDKSYFWKERFNKEREEFKWDLSVVMFYFCIYNVLLLKKKQICEMLKFNRTGGCIYEYLLHFYYTILERFIIKGNKLREVHFYQLICPNKNSALA